MGLEARLWSGFLIGFAICFIATPAAIRLAGRISFYDAPVGYKGHRRPTPYLGGMAVMAGFLLAVLLLAGDWEKTAPLVGGAALLWVVGTIDDWRTLSPGLRALVELALATLVWSAGLGWNLHAGAGVDLALTCFWVFAVVNAFNLFDNMDGAAGVMALAVSIGAATIGVVRGDAWLAVGAASLGGACLGFLPRNLSRPARIFLGDGGSMPIGFAAAVLVMAAARTSGVAWQSLLVGLLLVAVPALDTTLVVVSRRRRGVPVLSGGRDHLTHRARVHLPSARAVAFALGAIQIAISLAAALAIEGGGSFVVIGALVYVLAALAAIAVLEKGKFEDVNEQAAATMIDPQPKGITRAAVLLTLLGLGAGLSPFFFAYYDASVWVPIGLGLVVVCAVGVVARPFCPAGPATVALGGLFGLGVWSLASTAWAESVENAVVGGNRWLLYGALLLLMLVLIRSERRAATLLGAAALGVAAVAASVVVRLLGSDPGALFLGGRLNEPLGYINGEGCLFVMGFWLSMALAESERPRYAAPGAALATLMACLAMLSQSRGTALAMLGSILIVVALAPGRTRRVYALLVQAGAVAVASPRLLAIYEHHATGAIPPGAGHRAAIAALLSAAVAGAVSGLLSAAWGRLSTTGGQTGRIRTAATWLLVIPVAAALVVGVAAEHRIERDLSNQWHAFTHLTEPGDSASATAATHSRLLSGGGNRYDYWRVAWRVWREHPLAGVGAGNYQRAYYQFRATDEDIQQPHSIELQTLAELGVIGVLLLLLFLAGVGWGALRLRKVAARSRFSRALMTGALGAFTAWLIQTSVDWMHLLPGLTAVALAAAATLIWPRLQAPETPEDPARSGLRRIVTGRRALTVAASALLSTLLVAGASLSRQGLGDVYRARAEHELASDPAASLSDINRSLSIDSDSVQSYYLRAAALARFGKDSATEAALHDALRLEPDNFVTWALLGDIATREHRPRQAQQFYANAHRLNPRQPIQGYDTQPPE